MTEINPAYLEDASGFSGHAEAVHVPADEGELCRLLRQASDERIAVTIAGAGTGVAGGRVPFGGWVISVEKLRRLDVEPGAAWVGAGVLLKELQAKVAPTGQFYAPDPTEQSASVGGTIATNASGSRSFRCGDTRRHVLALRVAFADGTLREFARGEAIDFEAPLVPRPGTTKHSAGFPLEPGMDWVDLFIGSEGTLGVVTAAKLRLVRTPEEVLAGVIFFPDEKASLAAVAEWRGVPRLRMLEFFDAASLDLLRPRYGEVPRAARAALLIEQELAQAEDLDEWEARMVEHGALAEQSWFAMTAAERERFRKFRHALPEAVNDTVRQRGLLKMGTDFAVPLDRNDEMLAHYREKLDAAFPGQYVIFGHIGDAHVHVNLLPRSGAEAEMAKELMTEFARHAVSLGGSVGAEHGLGKRKAHFLALQYGAEQIEAMKAVKRRFDPHWLLGRGNLFPMEGL